MKATVSNMLVAAVSFLFGAGLTRWWNRARPLVLLQGFTDILKNRDDIQCPEELAELTKRSWDVRVLRGGTSSLGDIQAVNLTSLLVRDLYQKGLEKLDSFISELDSAAEDDDIRLVLEEFICNKGIELALSIALKRGEIRVPASGKPPGQPKLSVHESDKDDGSYLILWKTATSTFSSNLKDQAYLKPRLEPFIDALRNLDKSRIIQALRDLHPLLKSQLEDLARIRELIEPILNESGRWAARLLVANYGAAPMMIWPEARLEVRHKKAGAKFAVGAYAAAEYEESPKVRDIDGVYSLAPGEKVWVWVITTDIQRDMEDGAVLRTHYVQGDATAAIALNISRRGALLGKKTKSDSAQFQAGDLKMP